MTYTSKIQRGVLIILLDILKHKKSTKKVFRLEKN